MVDVYDKFYKSIDTLPATPDMVMILRKLSIQVYMMYKDASENELYLQPNNLSVGTPV